MLLLLAISVLLLGIAIAAWLHRRKAKKVGMPPSRALSIAGAICGITILFCLFDSFLEPHLLTVTRVTVPLRSIPAGKSLRIVQISDLHLTRVKRRCDRMVARIIEERPDIIVITGDIMQEYATREQISEGSALLQRISQIAPTYVVLGNHDNGFNPPAMPGCTLLRDGVSDVSVAGIPMRITGWDSPPWSFTPPNLKLASNAVNLLLVHTPDFFDAASEQGYDLALAGHTHGGQVRLPFWGSILNPSQFSGRFEQGEYQIGNMRGFISRGFGENPLPSPQIRFFCPPEVVILTLVSAE